MVHRFVDWVNTIGERRLWIWGYGESHWGQGVVDLGLW